MAKAKAPKPPSIARADGNDTSVKLGFDSKQHLVGMFFSNAITEITFHPDQAEAIGRGLLEHARFARGN